MFKEITLNIMNLELTTFISILMSLKKLFINNEAIKKETRLSECSSQVEFFFCANHNSLAIRYYVKLLIKIKR